jgi:NAD(P)H-quinone oxidoreductase subunit 5
MPFLAPPDPSIALAWLPAAAPLACAAAALASRARTAAADCWSRVCAASSVALAVAGITVAATAALGRATSGVLRVDLASSLVLLLVAFIGWVITRYAATYLQGERDQPRSARWFAATLAGSMTVVLANHLLLVALAWWGTSLALHRLLLTYRERAPARIAAHKKFLLARAADLCMLGACVGFALEAGSLRLDALAAHVAQAGGLGTAGAVAAVLVALAAILKCAQLPFHGWLIQVMEAPTPVSALLHAGVVNLGGFVLWRLAPVVEASLPAQLLLVGVGTATAVLAALVMTTRISVKVALAWSTCAQMGFMLLQCGLGLWEMALLHLVAHSLYKAHAFLASGERVRTALVGRLAPAAAPGALRTALAAAGGLALVAAAAAAWGIPLQAQPALAVMAAIVALALNPLLAGTPGSGSLVRGWCLAALLALGWFGLHALLAHAVVPPSGFVSTLWWIPALAFAGLFALQPQLANPRAPLARRLQPLFYGGLFLDERLSRVLLRVSPPPSA